MKLVNYNIQFGRGSDRKYDLARIASAVGDADIIALADYAAWTRRTHRLTTTPAGPATAVA